MNSFITRLILIIALVLLLLAVMVTFQVRENQSAVQTRFGAPVRVIEEAGLYWRLPWPVDNIILLDERIEFYEVRLSETLTRDKRNVIIPVYIAWRIDEPLQFVRQAGTRENARAQLESLVTSARNAALARYDFSQLVSTEASGVSLPEIEQVIRDEVDDPAREALGVEVLQVGIKRIALPEANTAYVFERMRAERAQHAARFRAEGQREADKIRAEADAERTRILAEASRFAEETRGEGEAEAARIFATAHGQDPQLYQFLRELQTLRGVAAGNSTLILRTDAPPFNLLKDTGALDLSGVLGPDPLDLLEGAPGTELEPEAEADPETESETEIVEEPVDDLPAEESTDDPLPPPLPES